LEGKERENARILALFLTYLEPYFTYMREKERRKNRDGSRVLYTYDS
jgi:hypothetical protein